MNPDYTPEIELLPPEEAPAVEPPGQGSDVELPTELGLAEEPPAVDPLPEPPAVESAVVIAAGCSEPGQIPPSERK